MSGMAHRHLFFEDKEIKEQRMRKLWLPDGYLVTVVRNCSRAVISSVAQLCPTLCDPMNCSTPGLPVHHQMPEFTQTQVHEVGDAIQPSYPLSSPSPPAPNPSQHQSLFQWVKSTLRMRWPKYWSFSFSIIPSKEHPGLISLQSKGLPRVFSNTTFQKHQFFHAQLSLQSNSHIHTWLLEKP